MEPVIEAASTIAPKSYSFRDIASMYKDKLLNINKEQMIITSGIIMAVLTSAVVLGAISTHGELDNIFGDECDDEETKNKKEHIERTEEWKRKEWCDWKEKLEEDWKVFNEELQNEKKKFVEQKQQEWDTWIKSIDTKWTHYNPNMDKEFHTNVLECSANWTETQWREWIKAEGRLYLDVEWKKWFFEKQSHLDELFVKKWIQWKKDKIINWLISDWKREEQEHWEEFEKKPWSSKLFQIFQKRDYEAFKERTNEEWDDWFDWVKTKDNVFITNILDPWIEWTDEKSVLYDQWVESFITNWINKKQWTVWACERRSAAAKEKATLTKTN
ncbi:hypothetical protein AK88_04807 [Plasmodium fragile]|uniref:Tryptophan/threonine-rich plasmodium antigen C-terminal domain-containing protein n=1 Tax=Plasmodium fragile TaxID=5857 RepID=A0A0D9QII5_PLAFR|nr:uncharacterized protein AK88_04807 [Plasmodium fragile]KJP85541.1 hypothetical protein AK88_04807 [Plasmodium fragile]